MSEKVRTAKKDRLVYEVMKVIGPARTSQVAVACLRMEGIGTDSSTRYMRWLRERGVVRSYKAHEDDTELTHKIIAPFITKEEYRTSLTGRVISDTPPPEPAPIRDTLFEMPQRER